MLSLKIHKCFMFMRSGSRHIFINNFLISKFNHRPSVYNKYKYLSISSKFRRNKSNIFDAIILIVGSTLGACLYILWQGSVFSIKNVSNYNEHTIFENYNSAISKSRDLLQRLKDEVGIPGVIVGVSVDGKTIWEEGFGYADLENRVECNPHTVMRIASISKSITMAAVAKLWENSKLDLDKAVQHYLPEFPMKYFNGEPVQITCRQLVSHLAGIRHYNRNDANSDTSWPTSENIKKQNTNTKKKKVIEPSKVVVEFEHEEYYIKERYTDVQSSLEIFKNDPLVKKPGSEFFYSTHGFTLVSALVEKASEEPFSTHMTKLFKQLGMYHTYLDDNICIIYHRSRNYVKGKTGLITNAPYVDNSYKWAGGGFLSTVGDLIKFANIMLYSLQFQSEYSELSMNTISDNTKSKVENKTVYIPSKLKSWQNKPLSNTDICDRKLPGYLNSKTIIELWSPVTPIKNKNMMYAMGWFVLPEKQECEYCGAQQFSVLHTGAAIGASSVLFVMPRKCESIGAWHCQWNTPPKGIIVAIIANLQDVRLSTTAIEIAKLFNDSK